jgi:hypothetical protein
MRGTANEVSGDDVFEVMHTTAADWDSDDNDDSPLTLQLLSFFLSFMFSVIIFLRRNKLNLVSDDFNSI